MHTAVVLNDIQFPFHSPVLYGLVVPFVLDLKPDVIALNGDIVDMYSVSDFDKDPLTQARLEDEIALAEELMGRLSNIPGKVWLGGNHEDRLRRYIWRHAQAFAGLSELSFQRLFRLADYGFGWVDYGEFTMLGKLLVTHGDLVRVHSGMTARAHFDKHGTNILTGHTHRLGAYYRTRRGRPYVAYENGCLCSLTPEYVKYPDWQNGFSIVHFEEGGSFNVQQLPIFMQNGRPTFYYGKDRIQ